MVIARAPVRISFGGGGTDLAAYYARFGGFVVSAAITRYSYAVAREPAVPGVAITSADYRASASFPLGAPPDLDEPLALPKAALAELGGPALRERGVDLFLAAEIAPGTGLGSSSAMACALVRALAGYRGLRLSRAAVAEAACRIEIERLGMPIGKQDQYASAFGGLNCIELTATGVRVTPLALAEPTRRALEERLLLFSSGRTRSSSGILGQQRKDTETKPEVIESLHRIKALAYEMRDALLAGDLDGFGALLDRAWQQKRGLSGRVSNAEIDAWYAAAREAGALGGKITGAGGGGHLLFYCPPERQRALRTALAVRGLREVSFGFDFEGARVVASEQAAANAPALAGEGGAAYANLTRRFARSARRLPTPGRTRQPASTRR